MRALTVRQPWAWAIVHGEKNVENRTRNVAGAYRGPVAIHAAVAHADDTHGAWLDVVSTTRTRPVPSILDMPLGVVVGVVDLVDVHPCRWSDCCPCSPWAEPNHHHLVLANPRPLPRPIPWRGQLGLWRVPDDLERAIREQVQP